MQNQSVSTITEGGPYTVIIEFEVEPAKQIELIEGITAQVERLFQPAPAFISANFHSSFDGRRVVNYAQWTSKEAYETFMAEVGTPKSNIGEIVKRMGTKAISTNSYRVERVITAKK